MRTVQMRRGPDERIAISSGTFRRHTERNAYGYRDHANWSSCWPRGMPFPDMNRGLTITASSSADGHLTNFRMTGNDLYPVVSACLRRLMEGMTLGPAADGQPAEVQIGFGFYPVAPRMRRR
jgi:hypothetical protein